MEELRRVIREEEPARPSARVARSRDELAQIASQRRIEPNRLVRQYRGEMDWIVLKALEKDRTRRYDSVGNLARDIERYLAAEPVEAGPPGTAYRLKKYLYRHRRQTGVAIALLAMLIAGILGTSLGLIRADAARSRAEAAEEETLASYRASTDDAIQQLIGAKSNLGSAERAYLSRTLERWQQFAKRAGDDQRSLRIRSEANFRVANLWLKLGRVDEALPAYDRALSMQEEVLARDPENDFEKANLANICNNSGIANVGNGNLTEGLEQLQRASRLYEQLMDDHADVLIHELNYASSLHLLAMYELDRGDYTNAMPLIERARELLLDLNERDPGNAEYVNKLATIRQDMGTILVSLGKSREAMQEMEAAALLFDELERRRPLTPDNRWSQSVAKTVLGRQYHDVGDLEKAASTLRDAISRLVALTTDLPAVSSYRIGLADARIELGEVCAAQANYVAAIESFSAAERDLQPLVADVPNIPEYPHSMARAQVNLGDALLQQRDDEGAMKKYREALAMARQAVKSAPASPLYRHTLAFALNRLGLQASGLRLLSEARELQAECLELRRQLADEQPADFDALQDLVLAHNNLGAVLLELGDFAVARPHFEAAMQGAQRLMAMNPQREMGRVELARSQRYLGMLATESQNPAEASRCYNNAIETLAALHVTSNSRGQTRDTLAHCFWSRADEHYRQGQFAKASADYAAAAQVALPSDVRSLRVLEQLAEVRIGNAEQGLNRVTALVRDQALSVDECLLMARLYAVASETAPESGENLKAQALQALQQAAAKDGARINSIATEKDLDSIRDREQFQRLLNSSERGAR